jgi:carboxymethylenebutenolidase
MKAAGKAYEPITYDGAGHGFMRAGEDPTNTVAGNKTAREQAFARLVKLLHEMKTGPKAGLDGDGGVTAAGAAGKEKQQPVCHDAAAAAM